MSINEERIRICSQTEIRINNNSSIYCNIRMANQLTPIELDEWNSSGLPLIVN